MKGKGGLGRSEIMDSPETPNPWGWEGFAGLAGVARLLGTSSRAPKGRGLGSQSGRVPRLCQGTPGWGASGRQRTYVPLSHQCFSLSLSLSLSLKSINVSLGEDGKEGRKEGRQAGRRVSYA